MISPSWSLPSGSEGKSLAEIARNEISPLAGLIGSIAILIILVIALAGLGLAVVNALRESSWGTFTIAMTIPIALFVGLWMYRIRPGKIVEASIIGVDRRGRCVVLGSYVPGSFLAPYFTLSRDGIVIALVVYGFIASVLPVWLLLVPRDYLSSYMKIGTIAALVVGVILVNPELKMPAMTQYIDGGGPIIPGKLFPFLFVTIACGAISGFHALVSSGTTPKTDQQGNRCPIHRLRGDADGGAGRHRRADRGMLAASGRLLRHQPVAREVRAARHVPVNLDTLSREVGETVAGRPGGAVSLAVGFAQIFTGLPGLETADVVLVPLCDHVRGPVHPHHDRCRNAGDAVHGAGIRRTDLETDGTHRLASGQHPCDDDRGVFLGLFPLDGEHQHDLADVRNRQPAPGGGRALGGDERDSSTPGRNATRGSRWCRWSSWLRRR